MSGQGAILRSALPKSWLEGRTVPGPDVPGRSPQRPRSHRNHPRLPLLNLSRLRYCLILLCDRESVSARPKSVTNASGVRPISFRASAFSLDPKQELVLSSLVYLRSFLFFSILAVLCCSGSKQEPKTAPLPDAHALLVHAQELMGLGRMGDSVLHFKTSRANSENYQSDRTYPPFFYSFNTTESWFDP